MILIFKKEILSCNILSRIYHIWDGECDWLLPIDLASLVERGSYIQRDVISSLCLEPSISVC